MFFHNDDQDYQEILPGIKVKTLVYGEKTLLSEFMMAKDSQLPLHSHPEEQTGYLVSGCIVLHANGEAQEMHPGDSWSFNGNQEHRAEILEDSVAVEVFAPVRQSYLPYHPHKV
ncbi:MAG: cupin domain-containing protein [Chloroflexi bacterium HGW-Chloroflexi-4]|jgi:quercetin dioxygenase-like cupin family protein|nr:MAG: cupin domain-containing protein [Methanobacteriales archaeon HGW-Methanobacteriales-2]PKN99124.1 MAG: cupin domain-containing protein [Chloroflexi bacterium HGW-Chloroflexi-4]